MPKNIQHVLIGIRPARLHQRNLRDSLGLLLTAAMLLIPAEVYCDVPRDLTSGVVTISSGEVKGCATGFFLADGRLITNEHVVKVLCPKDICENLILKQANTIGAEPRSVVSHGDITVMQRLSAFDLAVLSVKPGNGPLPVSLLKLGPATQSIRKVSVLGFPSCSILAMNDGEVSEQSPLYYQTTTLGSFGSSGSPIFTEDYTVIGIAHQAGSVSEGILSSLFGSAFQLRAVNAEILGLILGKDESGVLSAEASVLERHYREHIASLIGFARIIAGLEFSDSIERIKEEVRLSSLAPKYAPILMPLGDYPLTAILPKLNTDELGSALQRLVFISNLEYRGPNESSFMPLSPEAISPSLARLGYSANDSDYFAEMVTKLAAQHYAGAQVALIFYGIYGIVISWLVLGLFAGSLGYVFAVSSGTIRRRLGITLLVAILVWPISFFAFLIRRARRQNAKTTPKRETVLQAKKKSGK